MSNAKNILEFLNFSEKLKTQLRDNKLSTGRLESVADHSWHVALMILLIEPHLKNKIDVLKSLKMALIHDITEADIGDIPLPDSFNNEELREQKKASEEKEIQKIKEMLDNPIGEEIYNLWHEREQRVSSEAKFVKAIDSLEANHQSLRFGDMSYWDDRYFGFVFTKCKKHCEHEDILQELNEELCVEIEKQMEEFGVDVEHIKKNQIEI